LIFGTNPKRIDARKALVLSIYAYSTQGRG